MARSLIGIGLLLVTFSLSGPTFSGSIESPLPIVKVRASVNEFVVYDWAHEHCEQWDVPDAPLRAFRNDQNGVTAFASAPNNLMYFGKTIMNIKHSCESSLTSHEDSDPSAYSGLAFVTAVWTEDGKLITALIHNEYHADHFPNTCLYADSMKCWYTTILEAHSSNGGHTFLKSSPPAIVAAVPFRQDFQQGRHRGFFNPSNIIFHRGFYYMMTDTTGGVTQRPGLCLFRTKTVEDAQSWRGYDGTGYNSVAIDPYRENTNNYVPCMPVDGPGTVGSISWNPDSGLFLIVYQWVNNQHPDGVTAYSWSADLIHWSAAQVLFAEPDMSSHNCHDKFRYGYPSVLDSAAPGKNFDVVGTHPMLFLTRFSVGANCSLPPNRDLVRVQLDITK